MNHRATPEHVFPGMLFFEAHLKGAFDFPVTPELRVTLEEKDGIPRASLVPDQPGRVAEVEIYYSVDSHILTRFWRTATAEREGDSWSARLPVFSTGQPLFVMANVYYRLDHKVVGYRWMKNPPGTFGVSSGMDSFTPEQLASSGVRGDGKQNPMIEAEFTDFQDWYRLNWENPHWWSAWTRKVKDPGFAAPAGARLLLDVKVEDDTTLFFVVKDNSWGAFPAMRRQGEFYARVDLKGSPAWQTPGVTLADFKLLEGRQNYALQSWKHVTELGLCGRVVLPGEGRRIELPEGSEVRWRSPRFFRNLRWEVP
jgi:hypothetical protein